MKTSPVQQPVEERPSETGEGSDLQGLSSYFMLAASLWSCNRASPLENC